MRYTEILLTLGKDEAHSRIRKRVKAGRVKTTGEEIEYRTNSGLLLGTLSETELPSGETGSKLRYRTSTINSSLSHGRTTAKQLRNAVEKYRYSG